MVEHRKNVISWDECFMRMAHIISERSKDPGSQVGAVIATPNNVVVGMGYNGFPRGISSDKFPWEREGELQNTKYAYICHAEENAIYNANSSTKECKIYSTLYPCNECAKTIIQTGITEVIFESDKYNNTPACIAAQKMFAAAGITTRQYTTQDSLSPAKNKQLRVFVGKPGVGKSTLIKQIQTNDTTSIDVRPFVLEIAIDEHGKIQEEKTLDAYKAMYKKLATMPEKNIILELGTNHVELNMQEIQQLAKHCNLTVYVCDAPNDICYKRAMGRDYIIPEEALKRRLQRDFPDAYLRLLKSTDIPWVQLDMTQDLEAIVQQIS